MRLRQFTAPTVDRAMAEVRRELGEDAIIVAIDGPDGAKGARVTAALDAEIVYTMVDAPAPTAPKTAADEGWTAEHVVDEIRHALSYHGAPADMALRLTDTASVQTAKCPEEALTGALQGAFVFAPLTNGAPPPERPVVLVGPPGAGKTLAVAKLTLHQRRAGFTPTVLSADNRRAGGVEELATLTRLLGVDLIEAADAGALAAAVADAPGPVTIDTAGINPFVPDDLAMLAELVAASGGEPVLVLAAGGDPMESVDQAFAFAGLGVGRLFATKLDLARRIGGVLAAADAVGLALCDAGASHQVAEGLIPLTSAALTRFILPHAVAASPSPLTREDV